MDTTPPGQGNRTIEVLLERIANALEAIQRGDTSTSQDIPPIVPPSASITIEENKPHYTRTDDFYYKGNQKFYKGTCATCPKWKYCVNFLSPEIDGPAECAGWATKTFRRRGA